MCGPAFHGPLVAQGFPECLIPNLLSCCKLCLCIAPPGTKVNLPAGKRSVHLQLQKVLPKCKLLLYICTQQCIINHIIINNVYMHIVLYMHLFHVGFNRWGLLRCQFSVRQRVCSVLQQEPMLVLSKCIKQIFLLNLQLWQSNGGITEMCWLYEIRLRDC